MPDEYIFMGKAQVTSPVAMKSVQFDFLPMMLWEKLIFKLAND